MAGLNPRQLQALQAMFAQKQAKEDGLVEFRAGRAFMDEQTRMVTPDKKRGKIKLVKDEQGILKLQWFNRISKQKELDLMLMPTTSKWEKVNECTDGRVYLLRMIGSNRKHFFWMQEPDEEKDDEYFKNINKLCNGESIGDDKSGAAASGAGASGAAAANAAANAGGFGGFGAPAQSQGSGQDAMTQLLLNALRGTGNTGGTTGGATGGTGNAGGNLMGQMENMMREQQRQRLEEMKREPDLEDILDPTANEEIIKLLDDEKVVEELAQHLPESMRSRDDMIEQLQSPQFQGALRRLQSAINGPQMPTLLSQMGINVTNQNQMGVSAFVNAIQPGDSSSSSSNDSAKKTDDDGDSSMASKDDKDKKGDGDKDKDKSSDSNNDMYK
eukprot:CAMPEP_0201581064 /NCGR_PEP_ID=MMETSP0190_2-20130828/62135_1 /ASSEMBLY_ACC=CAM_ASM_000263 /TAXON_ID=37353 /ORGANISM="Rosalina sp." /LENGTH=384 /DNA_ID=CAMNT_0048018295 /DNA_START=92 /DNA_END=1246 /DNA_ORIENTATION=+